MAPPPFTFTDLAGTYEQFAKGRKRTWREDMLKIRKYLLPAWGSLPVREITRTHVHQLLDTLVAQGMTVGVNRVQAVISRMFTVALDRSLIDAHPAARMIKRFEERPSERVLTDAELRALWTGLDARPGTASDAVRLRLLLGQRGHEVAEMAWAEVDLDARVWEIPGRRTKNARSHTVPLPPTAHALLEEHALAMCPCGSIAPRGEGEHLAGARGLHRVQVCRVDARGIQTIGTLIRTAGARAATARRL